jgi:hypothetical protein
MKYLILLALTIASAILYRMGGASGYDKLWRRIGCAIVATGALFLFISPHWAFILHALLLYAGLTTYHDYFNDGKENWVCWLITGLVYGLAALPLAWAGVNMYAILIRSVVLGIGTMVISEGSSNVYVEEFGRGGLIPLTIPILLL